MPMTRKDFREKLNREHPAPEHRNGRFHHRSRPYGDYLWHQDREKFEVDYQAELVAEADTKNTGAV